MVKVMQLVVLLALLLCLTGGCEARWVQRFDDTRWEVICDGEDCIGSWDAGNSEWDSVSVPAIYGVGLQGIGTWVEGFRPTKIRVTFTGTPGLSMALSDSTEGRIAGKGALGDYSYVSGEELDITYNGNDIYWLIAFGVDAFSITNIEFLRGSNKLLWIWLWFFDN